MLSTNHLQALYGSSNQRIIDVPASLAAGEVVPWKDPKHFDWD